MTLKIGITGGIGSGKTVVCKIFKLLGVPIFEADSAAKIILNENSEVKEKLIHLFGEGIYKEDSAIDRKKLASIIFNDENALLKVNNIIHPEVRNEFGKWFKSQNAPYVLHEAAILFESGFYKLMDQNVLIIADEPIRIKRVIDRDNTTREHVLERINKQWADSKKEKLSDSVIYNNNELLIPQVLKIHNNLVEYGKIW